MQDRDLDRLRLGEEGAFRQMFEEQSPRVYALALRLADDNGVAADVTQEVFVQAWRGLSRFRGEASLTTWLHSLTVQVTRKHWRSEIRRRRREGRYLDERQDSGHTMPTELTMVDLEAVLRELSPGVRAAVVLVCIEQHPYAKVAEMLGIAEGTVKAQVHRGRQLLRERLDR